MSLYQTIKEFLKKEVPPKIANYTLRRVDPTVPVLIYSDKDLTVEIKTLLKLETSLLYDKSFYRENGRPVKRLFYYNQEGQIHRDNGPAVGWLPISNELFAELRGQWIKINQIDDRFQVKEWWVKGKKHREDGPAVEHKDGRKEYWIDDVQLTEDEFTKRMNK